MFDRINRKTQQNRTTSLFQVLDNFNFILLLIFFRKTLIILRDANYITVLLNNVNQILLRMKKQTHTKKNTKNTKKRTEFEDRNDYD